MSAVFLIFSVCCITVVSSLPPLENNCSSNVFPLNSTDKTLLCSQLVDRVNLNSSCPTEILITQSLTFEDVCAFNDLSFIITFRCVSKTTVVLTCAVRGCF
eukprot:PhF_6_TR12718/c0_g1_i1/m.20165